MTGFEPDASFYVARRGFLFYIYLPLFLLGGMKSMYPTVYLFIQGGQHAYYQDRC